MDYDQMDLPAAGHPLRKLGARLAELLDEDKFAECERLLLEGWAGWRQERAALAGLPDGALDGGWTARGIMAYAKSLEQRCDDLIAALKQIADGPWPDDCEGPEGQCRFDEATARTALKKVGAGDTADKRPNVQANRRCAALSRSVRLSAVLGQWRCPRSEVRRALMSLHAATRQQMRTPPQAMTRPRPTT